MYCFSFRAVWDPLISSTRTSLSGLHLRAHDSGSRPDRVRVVGRREVVVATVRGSDGSVQDPEWQQNYTEGDANSLSHLMHIRESIPITEHS